MKLLLTIIALLISISSYSQLRNTTWGMSSEEVKKIETAKLTRDFKGDLTYQVNINDLNCELEYLFVNNKLAEIKYTFSPIVKERTKQPQYATWAKTVKNISEKYGKPTSTDSEKLYVWALKDFSIKAAHQNSKDFERVIVSYSPSSPNQKEIL